MPSRAGRMKIKKLNAILVLGEQNAGKSTLIRHLSGVARGKFVDLVTTDKEMLKIRAIVTSVNELYGAPPPERWAARLIEKARDKSCANVLLPLRYVSEPRNPKAEAYFRALKKVAAIKIIAMEGDRPSWVPSKVFDVKDPKRNERARSVRRHLGWI